MSNETWTDDQIARLVIGKARYIGGINSVSVKEAIELAQQMRDELETEIARLRALLPDAEVMAVIRALVEDAIITEFDYELDINIGAASAWLDTLESETKCPYCLGTGIGVITTEYREDCRECYGTGERQSS